MTVPENVTVFGGEGRPLVILPGLSTTRIVGKTAALSRVFSEFTDDGFEVFLMDRKAVVPDGYTTRDLAEDAFSDMQALGIGKADVIGLSQGGMIAQYLGILHPESINKIVIGSSMAFQNPVSRKVLGNWINLTREKRYRELNLDIFGKLYSEEYYAANRELFERAAGVLVPDGDGRFINLATACLEHDASAELGRIGCPVLVVGAEKDNVLTCQASRDMAELIGCECFIFRNYGHAVYDETPEFYRKAHSFLLQN